MLCGQSEVKALVANIALQCTKAVEVADTTDRYCICQTNWYVVALLLIILLRIIYLAINKIKKFGLLKDICFLMSQK